MHIHGPLTLGPPPHGRTTLRPHFPNFGNGEPSPESPGLCGGGRAAFPTGLAQRVGATVAPQAPSSPGAWRALIGGLVVGRGQRQEIEAMCLVEGSDWRACGRAGRGRGLAISSSFSQEFPRRLFPLV